MFDKGFKQRSSIVPLVARLTRREGELRRARADILELQGLREQDAEEMQGVREDASVSKAGFDEERETREKAEADRDEAHRQGIANWGLPPHMFRVSPAVQAISHFKRTVYAVLAGASVEDGPIDESYVHEAAEFVCYANERFVHSRRHLSDTDLRTCYELNLGVPAWKGGLVPFGTAGYAWIPESLRSSRGGKHVTAEPVLCLGWQEMYSKVYKVLTPLGTVRHTSKVTWHHDQPLGKFLPVRERDMRMPICRRRTHPRWSMTMK